MSTPRQPLYERLPEIYRIRDGEQTPPGQLAAYLGLIDQIHSALRDNIEELYHDLFIDTCADWVIPYIADLLGTSHLSGEARTLRADVARTVRQRRRKGTLGAIESLTFALSGWAVHTVEMLERLVWNQHLNHQRPDAGGVPPLSLSPLLNDARRGGTVTLRNPALLTLLNGPFDPFAHVVDVKPVQTPGYGGFNLPNLAVFLWRLEAYTVPVSDPVFVGIVDLTPVPAGLAPFAVRFEMHPLAEPMVLFNTHRFHADDEPPNLTENDAVPGPMPPPRLTQDTPAGRPQDYIEVLPYPSGTVPAGPGVLGLTLHVPTAPFSAATAWRFRGANLCAWETGLQPPLRAQEIVVDPERGRVLFGVMGATQAVEAVPLRDGLLVSPTYGFAGPVGAHPIGRPPLPAEWQGQTPVVTTVNFHVDPLGLQKALDNIHTLTAPLIIEIQDSMTHELNLASVTGIGNEGGLRTLRLRRSLWIRAAADQKPVLRLTRPLAFRPDDVLSAGAGPIVANMTVKLEGLYLTRAASFSATAGLIERAAVNQLFIDGCTLDPGGFIALNGSRAPLRDGMRLTNDYGFTNAAEETAFEETPEIVLHRSITGALAIDDQYRVELRDSIVDAGSGVGALAPKLALGSATGNPELLWGPPIIVSGLTAFGRMRVESATGQGGIWVHALLAHDDQRGCIKFSSFAPTGNRLPPHHACVSGAAVSFVGETFGLPGYAQLHQRSDMRLLDQGPNNDEMGAFNFLLTTHKWKNIQIRYREYMPVGIKPVLIPIT